MLKRFERVKILSRCSRYPIFSRFSSFSRASRFSRKISIHHWLIKFASHSTQVTIHDFRRRSGR